MARARVSTKGTEGKELSLVKGELLECLLIRADDASPWCFVVAVTSNQDDPLRMGYVSEKHIYYI